jgi:hypothetical protein
LLKERIKQCSFISTITTYIEKRNLADELLLAKVPLIGNNTSGAGGDGIAGLYKRMW